MPPSAWSPWEHTISIWWPLTSIMVTSKERDLTVLNKKVVFTLKEVYTVDYAPFCLTTCSYCMRVMSDFVDELKKSEKFGGVNGILPRQYDRTGFNLHFAFGAIVTEPWPFEQKEFQNVLKCLEERSGWGNMDIIKLMISKDVGINEWNKGLERAC